MSIQLLMPSPQSAARPLVANVQPLEPRIVLTNYYQPTAYEQYFVELINRARANPAAEAARLGVELNEGVAGPQISTAAKQPLVINTKLGEAIRAHVGWLRLNSLFQHAGQFGTTPEQRIVNSGYTLSGNYGTAENLGLTLGTTLGDLQERVTTIYRNLFVDQDVSGRGHRVNFLNGTLKEAGSGIASGDYRYNDQDWTAIIAGQDFAFHPGNSFLTGVIFQDDRDPDDFYSPGEGKNNVTVTAVSSTGVTHVTTTNIAGGYSIQLPPGTYTLTAGETPGGVSQIGGSARYTNVVVGSQNVKRDFEFAQFGGPDPAPSPATISNGTLSVQGTTKSDVISVLLEDDSSIAVTVGSTTLLFDRDEVDRIVVNAGNRNDYVLLDETLPGATILGGSGNDTLIGTASSDRIEGGEGDDAIKAGGSDDVILAGAGNDSISGEGGKDTIHGDEGIDRVNGNGGNDRLFGDADADRVYGGDGADQLDGGGGTDRLSGDDGNDTIIGGSSNDRLYGRNGDDQLWGGRGTDYFDGGAGTNTVHDRESAETVLNAIG